MCNSWCGGLAVQKGEARESFAKGAGPEERVGRSRDERSEVFPGGIFFEQWNVNERSSFGQFFIRQDLSG